MPSLASTLFAGAANRVNKGEGVVVTLGGKELRHWESISLKLSVDAAASFEVVAPFDPSSVMHRSAFRPFRYESATVTVDGEPVLTGSALSKAPSSGPDGGTVTINGYAAPGILADCSLPPSAWRSSYTGKLEGIAKEIAGAYGVAVEYEGPAFSPKVTKLDVTAAPWTFLAELAKQAGLVLTSTPSGALRMWAPKGRGAPVASYLEGERPALSVSFRQASQAYFSHLVATSAVASGRSKTRKGAPSKGGVETLKNPLWAGVGPDRVNVVKLEAAEVHDVKKALQGRLGRMLAGAASWELTLPTWRDATGNLLAPGNVVRVEAPGAFLYHPTNLMIRTVNLTRTRDEELASLDLVFPGAFSGEAPARFPWG